MSTPVQVNNKKPAARKLRPAPKKQSSRIRRAKSVELRLQQFDESFFDILEHEEDDEGEKTENYRSNKEDNDNVDKDWVRENADKSLALLFGGSSTMSVEDFHLSISNPDDSMMPIGNISNHNKSSRRSKPNSVGSPGSCRQHRKSSGVSPTSGSTCRHQRDRRTRNRTSSGSRTTQDEVADKDQTTNSIQEVSARPPRSQKRESRVDIVGPSSSPSSSKERRGRRSAVRNAPPSPPPVKVDALDPPSTPSPASSSKQRKGRRRTIRSASPADTAKLVVGIVEDPSSQATSTSSTPKVRRGRKKTLAVVPPLSARKSSPSSFPGALSSSRHGKRERVRSRRRSVE